MPLCIIILAILISYNILCKKYSNYLKGRIEEYKDSGKEDAPALESLKRSKKMLKTERIVISCIIIICEIVALFFTCYYTQDPGQASVLTTFNRVSHIDYTSGLRFKAPWQERIIYDIRNNTLNFVGPSGNKDSYSGGDVSGPQITFQDANGVTGNIDLNARYSISPDTINTLYQDFKSQEEFVNTVITPTIRSLVREAIARYDTTAVYESRDQLTRALTVQLAQQLGTYGVELEELYLQEVRYPDEVVQSFTRAQAAKAEVDVAKAEQEKAKVEAETNKIKSSQLTDAILKEKLIEAIRNGNGTYIIDTNNISVGVK